MTKNDLNIVTLSLRRSGMH